MAKFTLITGASEGLGVEFARIAANEGHSLILTARSEDKLNALAAELRSDNNEILVIPADLSKDGEAEQVWSACMLGQGFDFATELSMRNYFFDAVRDARGGGFGEQEAGTGAGEALLRVADMERQVAQAALNCTPAKDVVEDEVRNELEARYLSANGELLAEVRQIGE